MLTKLGIHPLAAFGVVAVDFMLFGQEAATLGIGWLVSVPVAAALGLAVGLIQSRTWDEDMGLAVGKGLLVAVLTAIPTPLPSAVTAGLGLLGAVKMLRD